MNSDCQKNSEDVKQCCHTESGLFGSSFDTGPILRQNRRLVPEGSTVQSLATILAREGADLVNHLSLFLTHKNFGEGTENASAPTSGDEMVVTISMVFTTTANTLWAD